MVARGQIEAGSAFVRLFVKDGELRKGLKAAKESLDSFAATAGAMGAGMVAAGAAIAAPIAASVKVFADFQDQMAAVGAVTQASDADLAAMTEQAKYLGRTTSYTASQIAALQLELGRAGFKPDQIIASTEAIQNLGRATNTDLAKAAEIAGAALKQFGLPAEDAVRVADVLTAAANNSAQTVTDMGEAFAYVGPVATDAGLSIEDTAKALGVLANLGLKGSMGGTGFRRAVLAFADPKVQEKLRGLGVEALDAEGNLRPIADVMLELGRATDKLPNAQRLALFQEMFDLRGMTAGMKLSTSVAEMQAMSDAIDNSGGAAARTAAKMDDTLGGTFRRIMSAVEGVQIAIGEGMQGSLRGMEGSITSALLFLTAFVAKNRELVLYAAGLAAGLIAAGGAIIGIAAVAKVAALGIGMLLGAMSLFSGVVAIAFGPAGLIVAGLAVVTAAWMNWTEIGEEAMGKMATGLDNQQAIFGETFDAIKERIAAGDYSGAVDILMAGMAAAWHQGLADLLKMTGGFAKATLEVFVGIASAVAGVWTDMQAGIAKKLLDWADQEGFVGEQMRAFLGVDPREKTAQQRMTQQQRAGLSEQVRVWEDAKTRVGASGTVESGVLQGTTGAELDQWIAEALAKMQMDNAGLTAAQLGVATVADAQAQIDRDNARRQAEIDASLGGLLSGFDAWAGEADSRAAAARQRITEAQTQAQTDAYAADFAAAMEPSGPAMEATTDAVADTAVGLTRATPLGIGTQGLVTHSAAALQAMGQMGGSPQERMARGIESVVEKAERQIEMLREEVDATRAVVGAMDRMTTSLQYGAT